MKGEMMKTWNQDDSKKYDPRDVTEWDIVKCGSKWRIEAVVRTGRFSAGLYGSRKEAKAEVDRLDALSEMTEDAPESDSQE